MRRYLLLVVFTACGIMGFAQPYKNEWIDYSKTYYKFPVAAEGLYRISKSALTTASLSDVNARDFQLWRDGEQQPIFTTEATGPLAADGYIEFYGRPLDGKQDADLFPDPENHVYKDLSFFSDTAWYFLTVNSASANLRFTNEVNSVGTTTLLPDSFFMHTSSIDFFRGGFSYNYNYGYGVAPEPLPSQLILRSSIWDQGEGFASTPFNKSSPMIINMSSMQAFKNGPAMKLFTSVVGAWIYNRNISVSMNDSVVYNVFVPGLQQRKQTISNIPLSRITNDAVAFKYTSDLDSWPERSQANALYLTYPRSFSFGNNRVFAFNLSANTNGNHLRIGRFSPGAQPAILLDLTNYKRYTAVSKGSDSSLLAIAPSATDRKLVLANQADFLKQVSAATITPVQFVDYSKTENQGDYLIITSNLLRNYNGTDQVEAYKNYRSSAAGGGFKAKVVDVEQLYDQYALGVRKNPLSIRRFIQYAAANFAVKPKFVLLMGHAVDYLADRYSGNYEGRELLDAVPTWGSPASDNLLAAANGLNPTPLVPIGRISVVNGKEIGDYLDKVKQYEDLASNGAYKPELKAWKKQAVQLVGGDDAFFATVLTNFENNYARIIADTLSGVQSKIFVKINNPNYAEAVKDLTDRINKGVGLISYFGHSSTSSIDFNLASPDDFTNTDGKYPVFIANGCQAGNLFFISSGRLSNYGITISERFLLAPKKGAIAFLSNSDFGMYNYLNIFTTEWMKNNARAFYGKGLGIIEQNTVKNAINITGPSEFFNRSNTEQSVLHGDPAIALFKTDKPDYTVTDSLVNITPLNASVAEDSLQIKVSFLNLGKAVNDSVWVDIKREFPDGSETTAGKFLLRKLKNKDSVSLRIPVKGIFDKGTNYIIATIDPTNQWEEMSESNNTARVPFEVNDEEIRPVYPYNFSIVNKTGFRLTGSTVNAVQDARTYRIQIDTTELFNSPLLFTRDTTTIGGAVSFDPKINWQNGTVYYWRLAPVFSGIPVNWRNASFQYLQGTHAGWGQSHYFQHSKSVFNDIALNNSRSFTFGNTIQNLYIINSIYGYSGDEDNHFSITRNGITDIFSACVGQSILFNVFDSLTFQPWSNTDQRYGSGPFCNYGREYNFEFPYFPASNRKKIMDFLDSIPKGMIVTARLTLDPPYDSALVKYWQRDTAIFGPGKSLYHSLYNQGFYKLDSMYRYRTFSAVFKKDDSVSYKPDSRVSDGLYDRLNTSYFIPTIDTAGEINSPKFGPSATWYQMHWKGHQPSPEIPGDAQVQLIGIDTANKETLLKTFAIGQWDNDISDIDGHLYPFLRLKLITSNGRKAVPYQLDYWRLFDEPVADGALSALDRYEFNAPVLVAGKNDLKIRLAFKNVGEALLDSSSVRVTIADRAGNSTIYDLAKFRPLAPGDTATVVFDLPTATLLGRYYAYIQVNRGKNPTEQTYDNNFTYIPFEVVATLPATLLDFTATPENSAVRLKWKVTNEQQVASYVVEHSASNSASFKEIGNQKPQNQGADASYTLLHQSPAEGANYYRIKTVDQSGSIRYSPIRQVLFTSQASLTLYPNPFKESIYVTASGGGSWLLEVFTVQGQRLLSKNGNGSAIINTSQIPAGTYLVKVTDNHGVSSMKFEKHY